MAEWGTKQFFDGMFENSKLDTLGDGWLIKWRGSQKFRYSLCLDILKSAFLQNSSKRILDIGCALGNFTIQAWKLNPKTQFYVVDVSNNAISYISKKYPQFHSAVAAIPGIPFQESSFDCVICLEVLYYLDTEGRRQGIENISRVLQDGGILLFSAVLDGGKRYFAEEDIIQLISDYFDIQQIKYNYARLYTFFELKFMKVLGYLSGFKRIINMSNSEYKQWIDQKQPNMRLRILNCFMIVIYKLQFAKIIVSNCFNLATKSIMVMLGWNFLPVLCQWITKLIMKDSGRTQIIILARKK
ncbi:MAG: hypothetical protein QG588_1983 [Candidatus Poribacteria bacterium]|nr:hypothetical protein [Candidatus Poribacteria bacterium]